MYYLYCTILRLGALSLYAGHEETPDQCSPFAVLSALLRWGSRQTISAPTTGGTQSISIASNRFRNIYSISIILLFSSFTTCVCVVHSINITHAHFVEFYLQS